jgi:hypothetical protein
MEGLGNSVTAVIQLWKPTDTMSPEDGGSTFSETWVKTAVHGVDFLKTSINFPLCL